MKFSQSLPLLALPVLLMAFSGCFAADEEAETVTEAIDEGKGEQIHEVANSSEIAPYFESEDLTYHDIEQESDAALTTAEEQAAVAAAYNKSSGSSGTEWEVAYDDIEWLYNWYSVAEVNVAPYEGWHLVVLNLECEGPCFTESLYRFVWDEATNDRVFLPQYSNEYLPDHLAALTENQDTTLELNGLELPETLALPEIYGTSNVLILEESSQAYLLEEGEYDVMFESDLVGTVYETHTGCFYVQAPDGSVARYSYDPGFGFAGGEGAMVTWTATGETTNLTTDYGYMPGGCGLNGTCYLLTEAAVENLTEAGTTDTGETLYTVANPKEDATVAAGDTVEQELLAGQYSTYVMMTGWEQETDPTVTVMTFEEYVAQNPLLYWQDPFGRWTTLVSNTYRPPVECGKPVVYLYPEETMEVSVKVEIDELTVSIPEHGDDGWTVLATPTSELTNLSDNEIYPYLFWEGNSYKGVEPTRGFVLARRNVVDFLESSLAKLGLNDTERADFLEFWAPRMLDNPQPYFFVSFIGTPDFNVIAPLTITPAPDTLIRVFMAYRPLSAPMEVQPQVLRSLPRNGFTVVEWGGTASVPWAKEE